MVTAQPHPDEPAFNDHLAQAKLGALQTLLDLMGALARPGAVVSAATRELRLIATAILRTHPTKPAPPKAPPKPPTAAREATPASPTAPRPLHDAIALATHAICTTAPPRPKGNPDVLRLLARRSAIAAGAPAP